MRILKTKKNFRSEFKRQLRYAIAAAVGVLIILVWRDAIIKSATEIVEKIQESTQITATSMTTAILITVLGVIIIVVSSKLLKDKR